MEGKEASGAIKRDVNGAALPSRESRVVFHSKFYILPLRLYFSIRRVISFGIARQIVLFYMIV
jgi:hypothetical protein